MTVRTTDHAGVTHPLQRLSADEIRHARALLEKADLLTVGTRFAYLALEEPSKDRVLAFQPGELVDRRVRALLLDVHTGQSRTVVASLTRDEVDEVVTVDEIVKADPGWVAAMRRRGIADLDLVRPCPLSAGVYGIAGEPGHRLGRVL